MICSQRRVQSNTAAGCTGKGGRAGDVCLSVQEFPGSRHIRLSFGTHRCQFDRPAVTIP